MTARASRKSSVTTAKIVPLIPVTGSSALRKQLAGSLDGALGQGWAVFPDDSPKNLITRPTLILERTSLAHGKSMGTSTSTYTLIAISNQVVADSKEDYLDELIDQLTGVLDDLNILWSKCDRAVYNGTNPCYQITFTSTNSRK